MHPDAESPASVGTMRLATSAAEPAQVVAHETAEATKDAEPGSTVAAPPCHGSCARAALQRICGGGWTGPDSGQTYEPDMLVSKPACVRCADEHSANLTALGVGPAHGALACGRTCTSRTTAARGRTPAAA